MFDEQLRTTKARALSPITRRLRLVSPTTVTMIGFVIGLCAAATAARGLVPVSVVLWWGNRLCDGLDGEIARMSGRGKDLGGYLDLLFDVIIYAAVPFGIAWHQNTRVIWIAYGAMVATFYVNTLSWNLISALINRQQTSVTVVPMPKGLIEGAETIVAYSVFLVFPQYGSQLFGVFAALVALTIVERSLSAARRLR